MKLIRKHIAIVIAVAICIILLCIEPLIFETRNLINIAKQAGLIAIFVIAQSIVLIVKGLDLSQGGVITLVSVIVAMLCTKIGLPAAIGAGLILGCICGALNGAAISKFDISPFVVTLGTGFLFQGIALVLSNGQPIFDVPSNFSYLGWGTIFGIPIIVYILIALSVLIYLGLKKLTYGRFFYAVGSNEVAAVFSGINVFRVKLLAYLFSGLITGLGGIILASRINGGHPTEGINTPLQSVAAAVIGGVSLFGGKGTVVGMLAGAVLLAFISNALSIMNISSYYQQIVIGIIIIFAIIIDKLSLKLNLK